MIQQILFALAVLATVLFFFRSARIIVRNINLGRPYGPYGQHKERIKKFLALSFGHKKMFKRPVAALMHLFVLLGFFFINVELIEIFIDGFAGTHRILSQYTTGIYNFFVFTGEILAILVIIGSIVFLYRRNVKKVSRFQGYEISYWSKVDANVDLVAVILLMVGFLAMNTGDAVLFSMNEEELKGAGLAKYASSNLEQIFFPISSLIAELLPDNIQIAYVVERTGWWVHILLVFGFLNYLPYSKHFHIIMAFPNTYLSSLDEEGKMDNMTSITGEIKAMMDPNAADTGGEEEAPDRFGAKDANDLTTRNLMDAYSCTECGRCTAACPANQTGKLLSPRKIMMDTRDRIAEIGEGREKEGENFDDGKSLLGDFISKEELWACTTCQACVEECPVGINPLDIIYQLRRYMILEEADTPEAWTQMLTSVENNGAPWQLSPDDRFKWADEFREN